MIHPALPSHPGHAIWKRDFTGACGLFAFVLKPVPDTAVNAFLNALSLFGMGASWGGFESLAIAVRLLATTGPRPHGRRAAPASASTSGSRT